jgi:hypothetical protein
MSIPQCFVKMENTKENYKSDHSSASYEEPKDASKLESITSQNSTSSERPSTILDDDSNWKLVSSFKNGQSNNKNKLQNSKSQSNSSRDISNYCLKGYYNFPSREIIKPIFKVHRKLYYGIIAFCASEKKWLFVKNRYTASFCQLIQGGYRNVDIKNLVLQLRWDEWQQILYLSKRSFDFDKIYHSLFPFSSTDDIVYAKERFLANGPEFNKINIVQETLLQNQESWKFPSGIKKHREEPQEAAIRNYKICTQYAIQEHDIVFFGKEPISQYKVSDSEREEHHYWIVIYNKGYPPLIKSTVEIPFYTKWFGNKEIYHKLPESGKELFKKANNFIKREYYTKKVKPQ